MDRADRPDLTDEEFEGYKKLGWIPANLSDEEIRRIFPDYKVVGKYTLEDLLRA